MGPPRLDVADDYSDARGDGVIGGVRAAQLVADECAPPLVDGAAVLAAYARPRHIYATGLEALDELLGGGVRARQLVTVCAPTGAGKSSLVGTWAIHWGRAGVPVVWGLGELEPAEQAARWAAIAMRGTCGTSHVTPDDILADRVTPADAARAIAGLPLYSVDLDGATDPWSRLAEAIAAAAQRHGAPPIAVIDYLQALVADSGDGTESRHPTVSRAAACGRRLARAHDCAVVAISSVSRAYYGPAARQRRQTEATDDPRTWLAAAKESGDVEYASAVVLYVDVDDTTTVLGERIARIALSKSRDGRTGYVGARHHGPSGLWAPDGAAVTVMARGAGGDRAAEDDRRVLEYVRGHRGLPRRAVRGACGMSADRADAAMDRLLAAGRLIEESMSYTDSAGRRRVRGGVVAA